MPNARYLAVTLINEVESGKAYSNIALNKMLSRGDISHRDRSFITALFYGVLDRRITIDYILSKFIKTSVRKLKPVTSAALAIAVYQIYYMDKIPHSAAVNESVNIVKSSKERYNTAFVNAVLHSVLNSSVALPEDDSIKSLSIRYSCPESIVASFIDDYGIETAKQLLLYSLKTPHVTVRVNTVKTTPDKLAQMLAEEGIQCSQNPNISAALDIEGCVDISACSAYRKGLFHVQDISSQISIEKLSLKPDERIADLCAAPGGKTFTAAEIMNNTGEILSSDIYEKKVKLIEEGSKRLGLKNIKTRLKDACVFDPALGTFDAVICDVPCSGFGVIGRKPEIKYKNVEDFAELEEIQEKILENASEILRPGGRLLYSTCTLRKAENERRIKVFLDNHSGYELKYERTFMPQTDRSDGFYCALLIKSR